MQVTNNVKITVNKLIIYALIVVLILVFGFFYLLSANSNDNSQTSETNQIGMPAPGHEDVDEKSVDDITNDGSSSFPVKAYFEIYTLGTKRIFTDAKYHNLSDRAYISSSEPNAVFVTQENVTWSEFFETLPFTLNDECLVTGTGQEFCSDKYNLVFYLNDTVNPNTLSQIINEDDEFVLEVVGK